MVSSVFLDGAEHLGQYHNLWNGLLCKDKTGTKDKKEKELYVGSQPHEYARYYVDAESE